MKQNLFQELLDAARHVYSHSEELQKFAPWPSDLIYVERPEQRVPAVRQIKKWTGTHPLHIATQRVAEFGNWKLTYTEDEVGFGFSQDYGYLELYGPDGHFQTDEGLLTSATGAADFTIRGIVTKQKKFIRWSVGQVISKAKAQRQPN